MHNKDSHMALFTTFWHSWGLPEVFPVLHVPEEGLNCAEMLRKVPCDHLKCPLSHSKYLDAEEHGTSAKAVQPNYKVVSNRGILVIPVYLGNCNSKL